MDPTPPARPDPSPTSNPDPTPPTVNSVPPALLPGDPPPADRSPGPPPEPLGRASVVIISQVVHQTVGLRPLELVARRALALRSVEQGWQRFMEAGEEWKPVDVGWLGGPAGVGVSYLWVENQGVGPRSTNPTPAEAEEDAMRVVELGAVPAPRPVEEARLRTMHSPPPPAAAEPVPFCALAPAGPPAQLPNPPPGRLFLRCRFRTAKVLVSAVPL